MNTHTSFHFGEGDEVRPRSLIHDDGSLSVAFDVAGRTCFVLFATPAQLSEIGMALIAAVNEATRKPRHSSASVGYRDGQVWAEYEARPSDHVLSRNNPAWVDAVAPICQPGCEGCPA